MSGPCIVCGGTNYPLSFGGPTICPHCDTGAPKEASPYRRHGLTTAEVVIQMLGGNCPVQAEGTINGKPFYFRARGDSWRMNIGGADVVWAPEWSYEEDYGAGPFDAGWMTEDEARAFIKKSADKFARSESQAMPEALRQFLTDLQSEAEVKELHDWLDGNPCAVDEMIETILCQRRWKALNV